jgi:hypothetical protein
MMRRVAVPAALLFLLFVASSFLYVQLSKALTKTPCCADDAYLSLVAKTLALNVTYGVPLSSETVSLFDPEISSGPALIIPGAAMIAMAGAQPWATSLTTILLFAAALTVMTKLLATRFQLANVCLYTAISLLALVAITIIQDFNFIFIGEAPAFGYMIVGCAILATSRGRTLSVLLSGLCFSFALLTKHIALFCAVGASGTWFVRELFVNRSRTIGLMGMFLVGVAGPLAAFELVKLSVLGSSGYIAHWQGYLAVLGELHLAPKDRLGEFLTVLNQTYRNTVGGASFALASLVLTGILAVRRGWQRDDPMFGLMLFAGAVAHLLYILFISGMSERYFWLGMAMMAFAVTSPVLFLELRFALPVAIAVLSFVATPSALLDAYRFQLKGTDGRLAHERETVLREIATHPHLPIVSQWWGAIYDVIYLLKDNHRWYITNEEGKIKNLRALFVTYEPFSAKNYPFYDLVHRLCERVHPELTFYKVFICTGEPKHPNTTPSSGASP